MEASLNGTLDHLNNMSLQYLEVAFQTKKPVLTDLYYCSHTEEPHLDVIAPIFKEQGESFTPFGAVILCVEAQQFLFPLIQSWLTPSRTAETLLVRRDGDDVLFLNDLRHQENTALKLKRPLSQKDLPAAMAVLGKEGLVHGKDYRGMDVLAAIGPVPDSPWFIAAKVDADEAFSASRYRTRLNFAFTLGLLAAMLTLVGFLWQRRQKDHYLALYRAELDRQALRKHFEHLVKYANDIILLMDRELLVIETNDRALAAYGYAREKMLGLPVRDLVVLEELASHEAAMRELVEKGSAIYETVHRRKDGSPFPVEISGRLIDVEGERYIQEIIRDITERKRAEEALRENEEKYRTVFEGGAEAFFIMTDKFLDCNEQACRILSCSREDLIGHSPVEFSPPNQPDGRSSELAAREFIVAASSGKPQRFYWKHRRKDEVLIDAEISLNALTVGSRKLLFATLADVTDQKRAEARIEHLNLVLHAIRNVNQLIVREKDPFKLIQTTCQLLVETRGYGGAMIILTDESGAPGIFTEAGIGEAFQPLADNIRRGKIPPCCEAARSHEGVYFVTDRSSTCAFCPLASGCPPDDTMCIRLRHDGKTHGFLAVSVSQGLGCDEEERSLFTEVAGDVAFALHNIELEKEAGRAEEERHRAEAQLRQAQKMEALGTLAGGIAHDFNNILGIIVGYTEIARWEAAEGSLLRGQLQEVLQAAGRAADLVKQILAFSRQNEQEKKLLQISLIVKEALKMIRASLPSTIEIKSEVSTKAAVMADPTQIHQILMNLCTNAAHAMMEHGGLLEVSLTDVHLKPEAIKQYSNLRPGPHVRLIVKDTGHGIDQAIMDRIFDPFFTTKGPGVGTGLGLAVVHGLVKSHRGEIEVDSLPGRGATFQILFPAKASIAVTESEKSTPLPRGSERILLVDDEPALVMVVKQMLERLGYQADFRTGSIEALEAFRLHPDAFDLLITDHTMPKMTGMELAIHYRTLWGLDKQQLN